MSSKTPNFNLHKIDLTDAPPDITVLNQNWDTLDTELKELSDAFDNLPDNITVDSALSSTSTNPVQNKVVNTALSSKAPTSHASSATTYGVGTGSNYGHVKLSDATNSTSAASAGIAASPAAVKAAYDLANSAKTGLGSYLPLTGGVLSGALTAVDNFNVNKTFDGVEYKTYVRPINYSVGSNGDYSTGLIHYKGTTNEAQLMFNKDGAMLRDNVNGKAYQLFGQHNISTLTTALGAAKIQTGSYNGTGTMGSSNPCSLTFNFEPKLLIVYSYTSGNSTPYGWSGIYGTDSCIVPLHPFSTTYAYSSFGFVKLSADRKTVYWYVTGGEASRQHNNSGSTYYWVAIG